MDGWTDKNYQETTVTLCLHFIGLMHIPPEILAALRWNLIVFEGILPLVVVITIMNYINL